MTKHYRILFALGFIVFILPFLGIPDTYKVIIQFVVGFILILLSSLYRFWYKENKKGHEEAVFEESNGEVAEPSPYIEEELMSETTPLEETTNDEKES